MNPEIHDDLTGVRGSHKKAMEAINNLIKVGYCAKNNVTKLATATLYLKQNLSEITKIVRWAMGRGIKPTVDILGVHGRACDYEVELKPSKKEIIKTQKQFFNLIDGESVCNKNEPCKMWQYGIFISNIGDAKFCSEIPSKDIGNIKNFSLKKLLKIKNKKYPARAGEFTCPLKEKAYL